MRAVCVPPPPRVALVFSPTSAQMRHWCQLHGMASTDRPALRTCPAQLRRRRRVHCNTSSQVMKVGGLCASKQKRG
jgi:hypothetical protein